MTPSDVIKRPIALTEKAAGLREENKVVFEVAMAANKIQIRHAVESLFKVKVTDVNTPSCSAASRAASGAWKPSVRTGRRRS